MLTKSLLILTFLGLYSCSSEVQDMGDQAESPFEASEITAVRVEAIADNPDWSDIKNTKFMTLKTCLTNKATGTPIAQETFAVTGAHGSQEVATKMDGCLYWSEEFNFNYLSNQKLFEVNRTIVGTGNYKGSLEVNLAMDLWSEANGSVIDRSAHYVGRPTHAASAKNMLQTPAFENLYLDKVDIYATNLSHSQNYVEFDLRSVLTPVFQRRDLNGRTIKERLTAGKFDLQLWVLERKPGENRFKILAEGEDSVAIENGMLDNKLNVRIDSRPDMRSELLIGLSLKPINAPTGLRGLTGFVAFKNLRSVSDIRPLEEELEELLYKGSDLAADNFGLLIEDKIVAQKGELEGKAYEDTAKRFYSTEFKFCLVDAFTGNRVKEGAIALSIEDLSEGTVKEQFVKISRGGCVQAYEELQYNDLSTNYKDIRVTIRGADAPYKDVLSAQTFKIKQWQKSGVVSYHGKGGSSANGSSKKSAEIYSKELELTALNKNEDGFHINENLELSITRKYLLEMPLSLVHPLNPNGPTDYSSLNFGKFKVTFGMLSPKSASSEFTPVKAEQFDVVHYAQAPENKVKVENGILKVELDLETAYFDFHKLLYQNMFVVRVEPVNLEEVRASTFFGRGMLSKAVTNVRLSRVSNELQDLVHVKLLYRGSSKRKIRPAGSAMTISFYRNYLKSKYNKDRDTEFETYYLSNFNAAYSKNFGNYAIKAFNPENNAQLSTLCELFYEKTETRTMNFRGMRYDMGSSSSYQTCLKNPKAFVHVKKTKHIQKLLSSPRQIDGEAKTITSGDAYFISDGNQRAHDTGSRGSVGTFVEARAGGKFGFVAVEAGVKASYELYTMKRDSRIIADMDRSFTNVNKTLNVEQWRLGFDADVRNCLLITGKTPKDSAKNNAAKVIHVCANSNDRESLKESWAMITERTSEHSLVVDGRGMKENQFAQIVRGKENFGHFVGSMEDQNKVTVLRKVKDFDLGKTFEQMEKQGISVHNLGTHLDNAFPGLVE